TYNGVSKTDTLVVNPLALTGLALSPTAVKGGVSDYVKPRDAGYDRTARRCGRGTEQQQSVGCRGACFGDGCRGADRVALLHDYDHGDRRTPDVEHHRYLQRIGEDERVHGESVTRCCRSQTFRI